MTESQDSGEHGKEAREWMRQALFSEVGDAALEALSDAAERREITGGDYLVHQGDPADTLFFVQTGRFRVLIETDKGPRIVAQIEAGEPVGELAFFGGGTRTASLQASRDTTVLALSREAYDGVVARHPEVSAALLKAVSQRLAQVTARTPQMEARPPRVIAVLPAGASALPVHFCRRLGESITRITVGEAAGPDHEVVRGHAGLFADHDPARYRQWLGRHEAAGGYVLIDASGEEDWSELVCRNADALLMVAVDDADPALNPAEKYALDAIEPANRTLAIMRSGGDRPERGAMRWIEPRAPHLHQHMVIGRPADYARLARFLTGHAVGLVLAGGGALGCAHLGIVRGLQAAGIPIDYIGGTSAGAAMGAAIARGLSVDQTLDQMEAMFIRAKAMRRFTLPVHSLLDPGTFDRELKNRYGTRDIVDQPTGFFALSTNLSTNDLHIHRTGPLWEAVRASGSLPTILPPFIDDDGNILVDGGVLDNIPVVTMRRVKAGPNIVVTLGDANQHWRIKAGYHALRTRGRLLLDTILRRKPSGDFPSLIEVMSRSMVVASRIASRTMLRPGDILLNPPIIEGMQILDWHLGRKQAEIAAEYLAGRVAEDEDLQKLRDLG